MKLKIWILLLTAALGLQAAAAYAAAPSAQEAACASEDMQVFYYYLAPEPGASVKERPTKCHGSRTTLAMPGWLESALPAMRERKVWKDPEEGDLTEAQLWQTSISILYELASKTRKTLPPSEGGASVAPAALEDDYNDMRERLILSVARIAKAGLESSFGGRGTSFLNTLNAVTERMDALTDALSQGDKEGFNKSAGGALKLSRDLFAQLFEAPRGVPGARFTPKYKPEARIQPGYRGVSLSVPGSQVMFLSRGERADMLVTFDAVLSSGTKEAVTATILQDVVVLKVARPDTPDGNGVVQLLCNPNEAQYAALSLAQSKSINLIRRAPGDLELRPMEIASFRKLFK